MNNRTILDKYTIFEIDKQSISNSNMDYIFEASIEKWREETPMFPKPSFEEVKSGFTDSNDSYIDLDFLIKNNRKLVATASVFLHNPNSDAPAEKKEKAWVRIRVLREHRNKKIGTGLLKLLVAKLTTFPIKKLSMMASLESGHGFCKKYDGEINKTIYESYLEPEKIDITKLSEINSEATSKNPDIKIDIIDNLTEEDVEEYIGINAEFAEETSKYTKDSSFDKDYCIKNGIESAKKDIAIGFKKTVAYARDINGKAVGITAFLVTPKQDEVAQQLMTWVDKSYRKRGLCKLLKSRAIIRLKKLYPNIKLLKTVNDEGNSVMRKIIESLGFQQLPVNKAYSFELDKLKERLEMK